MKIETIEKNGVLVALVTSTDDEPLITNVQTALDCMMTVKYETGAGRIVLGKEAVTEDFFRLSTGIAGEILQKFINYQIKIAIYGDYSKYTSKPLRDFIYESNHGRDVFFAETKEEAVERLLKA